MRDALAMALLVAAQETIDITYHIVADEGWGMPDCHDAALRILVDRQVLDDDLATRVSRVGRVRNRLAHGYLSVDHGRIWKELPDGMAALEAFASAVARWLPAA